MLLFNRNLIFPTLPLFLFSLIQLTLAKDLKCLNQQYKNAALTSNDPDSVCSHLCVSYICKFEYDFFTGETCVEKVSEICNSPSIRSMTYANFSQYGHVEETVINIGRYILVNQATASDHKYEVFNSKLVNYNGSLFIDDSFQENYFWLNAILLESDTLSIKKADYLPWSDDAKFYIPMKFANFTNEINNARSEVKKTAKKVEASLEHNIEDIKRAGIQNSSIDKFEEYVKNAPTIAQKFVKESSEIIKNEDSRLRQFNDGISASINDLKDFADFKGIEKIHSQILKNVAESESKVLSLTNNATEIIQIFNDQMAEIENAGNEARKAFSNNSNGKKIAEFQIAFILFALTFIRFAY